MHVIAFVVFFSALGFVSHPVHFLHKVVFALGNNASKDIVCFTNLIPTSPIRKYSFGTSISIYDDYTFRAKTLKIRVKEGLELGIY